MNNVNYRAIERKDYDDVSEIICKAFNLNSYVNDENVLKAFKTQYLFSCLAEATYTCVAENNGQVIGVIMGNAKSNYRIGSHIGSAIKMLWYSFKMKSQSSKIDIGIDDYDKIHKVYKDFNKKHEKEFDGVLTLFAVSEASRGLGVGKTLWQGLFNYLKENKVKKIYLYTDSTCNTGFYDSQGFQRLEDVPILITRNGKPFEMSVYLYSYTIN